MVYLVAGGGLLFLVAFGGLFYSLGRRQQAPSKPPGIDLDVENELRRLHGHITGATDRLHDLEAELPTIRAEVAEVLTKAESRYKAARSAEERARKLGANLDEAFDMAEDQEEAFARLLSDSEGSQGEPEYQQPTFEQLQAQLFANRKRRR